MPNRRAVSQYGRAEHTQRIEVNTSIASRIMPWYDFLMVDLSLTFPACGLNPKRET